MLLPLLIFTTMLFGGWVFAAIILGVSGAGASAQPSIIPDRQVSLWSFICFLLFPSFNPPCSPSLPRRPTYSMRD